MKRINVINNARGALKLLVFALLGLPLLLAVPGGARGQAPDLTGAGVIATIDTTYNYNLGPTGMRGWLYRNGTSYFYGQLAPAVDDLITAVPPWQILVVAVGANTPASGIMANNDVILGVSTGAGNIPVALFTNDARKSIGWAIGAAEAGDGVMNLKRWRAGVTNDVSIQLPLSHIAYSATAPYNCPKSALILSNALKIIANESFAYNGTNENGYPGPPVLGLALLASGNTNYLPQVRTYARTIGPANLSLAYTPPSGGGQPYGYGQSIDVWGWGYNGVFLAEYYLLTGDANVLPAINQFTLGLAQGQSRYGTMAHGASLLDANGNLHGTMPPYGPVNQGGLVANMAIVMGRKAIVASGGVVDPEIDAAIGRAANFFGYYVEKGGMPYGEHMPTQGGHCQNGKDNLAALLFGMIGDQPAATEYFTRMSVAGYNGREYGHTGQGFSYLWGAMAANLGGTNALASYLAPIRWHLDLERRCDGSFVYDGSEQYGGTASYDYWNSANYNSIDPTACYVLTYALPLQQLLLTGRNADPTNWLSADEVTNAIWAGSFSLACTNYTTNQLMSALSEYDPMVRYWAAIQLGHLATAAPLVPALTNLVGGSTNPWVREAACVALGVMADTTALPVLAQALRDTNTWVRLQAAQAIRSFSSAVASAQLTNMLTALITNATDPNVIVWADPLQHANCYLSQALFGNAVPDGSPGNDVAAYTINAPTNLLYPAVRVGLKQPDSYPRCGAAQFAQDRLTLADVKALVPDIIEVAALECEADTMWSMNPRACGITTLANYHVAEALPLALSMFNTPAGFGWGSDGFQVPAINAVATYGDSARWTLPILKGYLSIWDPASGQYAALSSAIASISSAVTSPTLTNLYAVANSQVVVTTNAKAITLSGFSWRTSTVAFTNVTAPAHGTLTGTAPNLTYTPTGGYAGLDSFAFQVSDGVSNSPPATVSLIVGMPAGTGLLGSYYTNMNFSGLKFTRTDPQVNFAWGSSPPTNGMAATGYSVRWTGLLLAPESANYMFSTLNSDGVNLFINGVQVIDDWANQAPQWTDGASIALTAGQPYVVQMDYYEQTGNAVAKLKWTGPSFAGANGVIVGQQWLYNGAGVTNWPAIAYPQSVTMLQNTNVAITLEGAGNPTYAIATPPAHGTLSGTPPSVTYTTTNYSGTDSFTFTVNNGSSNSAPATVSIAIWAGQPVFYTWKSAVDGNWSVAGNWTNASAPAAAGQAYYTLNFTPAGTYSVTNDLNNGFKLNQLNVAGAVTFGGANSPSFAANGPLLPQINQNSGNGVTFNGPLDLAAMTTLGGTGGGQVTINGSISGAGGLTKSTAGQLTLLGANTYSGGTTISAGTLYVRGDQGASLGAAGSQNVTIATGAILMGERLNATGSLTMNGGRWWENNGFGGSWTGPVYLATNSFFGQNGWAESQTITGTISGPGGFTFSTTSGGVLTLSSSNSYAGPTIVTGGTVQCNNSHGLGNGGPLSISNGAVANLNYSGTATISALTLGGTNMAPGFYGSSSSPATYKDSHFSGSGTVTVLAQMTIANSPATAITTSAATLNATLGCAGTNAAALAYWNTVNGGTNAALWTNSAYVGSWSNVNSTNISYTSTGLAPNTTYYFTFRGTNVGGSVWATNVLSFTTSQGTSPAGLTWDANGTGAGLSDGDGAWINTSNTWWNGTANVNWADNNNAWIGSGGTGGTITLGTPTAKVVTFTNFSGTYTLTNGTLTVQSNLTVASSANYVALASVIGGPGGVIMNSSGTLCLYGLNPNTYSGGTIINSGTVIWGTMTNGISPDCSYACGTGPVTLNSGATLQFQRASPTNALILNGGTFWGCNGWGVTWQGPVTLNSNTTVQATYGVAISGNISGAGGLTKTDVSTLTLSGTSTYTGTTTISAGTLALSGSGSIASPMIIIASGATFDVSGLGSTFVLGGSQTLTNSASAIGTINGNLNTASGKVSVTYASGTPSLTVASGTLTLASGTVIRVNNTGAALAAGTYRLISKGTGSVAGTVPGVTVTGGGIAGGTVATLQITSGELYLTVTAPPAAPTNVVATAGNALVALSWNASSGSTSYNLKRSLTNGGPYTVITNVTSLTYTNTGLTNGTTYYYVLSALNGAGEGANSAQVSATPSGLPSPWLTADIGAVGLAGSASASNGTFTVRGSGTGITGTSDQFRFVYQTMTGDGSIKARIVSHSSTVAASLSGVMVRETTNANSMFAMSGHRGSGNSNMRALRRTSTGGTMASTSATSMTPPNCWVQVVRTGNSLVMMTSSNGTTWTTNNTSTITMATNILMGLISTSSSNSALNTNVFDNITVVP